MKENAKLQVHHVPAPCLLFCPFFLVLLLAASFAQKEVKYRISYMKDYMVKIEAGLEEDAKVQAEARDRRIEEEVGCH